MNKSAVNVGPGIICLYNNRYFSGRLFSGEGPILYNTMLFHHLSIQHGESASNNCFGVFLNIYLSVINNLSTTF